MGAEVVAAAVADAVAAVVPARVAVACHVLPVEVPRGPRHARPPGLPVVAVRAHREAAVPVLRLAAVPVLRAEALPVPRVAVLPVPRNFPPVGPPDLAAAACLRLLQPGPAVAATGFQAAVAPPNYLPAIAQAERIVHHSCHRVQARVPVVALETVPVAESETVPVVALETVPAVVWEIVPAVVWEIVPVAVLGTVPVVVREIALVVAIVHPNFPPVPARIAREPGLASGLTRVMLAIS